MLNPHCLRLLVGTLSAGKSQKDRKDPMAGERGMKTLGREGVEHMGLERGGSCWEWGGISRWQGRKKGGITKTKDL